MRYLVPDGTDFPENNDYLTKQIVTYIGNKRALLPFISNGVYKVKERLNKPRLNIFDVFSGSGIVARYFKRYADKLIVNDLEAYSKVTNECYLSNISDLNIPYIKGIHEHIVRRTENEHLRAGIITGSYAPENDDDIQAGERVFYTRRNAMYIDTVREIIGNDVEEAYQKFFLSPLLSEASVHSNTSGVFKGFYKDKETGVGRFGGSNEDAIMRIKGDISLPFPVFSNFNCHVTVYNGDSNDIAEIAPEVDIAYLDPPYNQHPYGSNYFMLNLILDNKYPLSKSRVSGIPADWNRSAYNKKQSALPALGDLITKIKAKYVLVSFNSEGFITLDEMKGMLGKIGRFEVLKTVYNTFRGSRNLSARNIYVTEYLYLLEK
jgi:adenine-specific DNA-methyltransferase